MKKKRKVTGSKETKRLYNSIDQDPDHKVYGVPNIPRSKVQAIGALIFALAFTISIPISLYLFVAFSYQVAVLYLVIIITIALCFQCPVSLFLDTYRYDRIILNDVGVGEENEFVGLKGRPAGIFSCHAIEWKDIESVEVKQKGEKVVHIKFKGKGETVSTSAFIWCQNLSLEIVKKYLPELMKWMSIPLAGEKHTSVYYSPDSKYAKKMHKVQSGEEYQIEDELIDMDGESDFEIFYTTTEHTESLSAEELYNKIENDSRSECLFDKVRLRWMATHQGLSCVLFILIFTGMMYVSLSGFFDSEASAIIGLSALGCICLYMIFIPLFICGGGKKLILNSIGIGKIVIDSTYAIEWKHVEFIDLTVDEGMIVNICFVGNRRILDFIQKKSDIRFTFDTLQKYIPDFHEWKKYSKDEWGNETTRYHRPEY